MTTAERQVVVPAPGVAPRPPSRGGPLRKLAPAHRDGLALVFSSGLTSVLGLLYWVVAARLFPPEVLGVNQVALSMMMLLGSVAHLNMTYALLRFVPVAGVAARKLVLLGYLVAGVAATVVGGVFALGATLWAPKLVDAIGHGRLIVFFLLATPVWSLFVIQDFVLTAVKRATAVPAENFVFSVLKIALLVVALLVVVPGGIAISWAVSTAAVVLVMNAWLLLRVLPAHGRATATEAVPITLGGFTRFLRADYAGAVLWQCALFGLPLLVLSRLGEADAAVYGIVWQISQSLYLVSSGMGQSMVAHSATDLAGLDKARRAMVRRALTMVAPVAVVIALGAPLWLLVFGDHYAAQGSWALALAALSAIPNVITAATVNAARVRQRMGVLFGVPGTVALLVIVGSWTLMPYLGIAAVGLCWLLAQTLVACGILVATAPWLPPLLNTRVDAMRSATLLRRVRPMARLHNEASEEDWELGELIAGKSDCVVVDFRNVSGGTGALLKAADSAAGRSQLVRQTEVLGALQADERLGGWRSMVPTVLRASEIGGSYCVVESRVPGERGVGALYDAARTRAFRSSSIATISEFHQLTSTPVHVGDDQLTRWVHEPMIEVVRALPRAHRPAAQALADRLADRMRGAVVPSGWAHGDYTPDNVLTDPAGQVVAVVDWCQADEHGMPLLDVIGFHLVSTFMVSRGAELGAIVLDRLSDLRPDDHQLLARTQRMLGGDVLDSRVVMVLGWLQHVAHNIEKSPQFAANPLWVRRNLVPVVQGAPALLDRTADSDLRPAPERSVALAALPTSPFPTQSTGPHRAPNGTASRPTNGSTSSGYTEPGRVDSGFFDLGRDDSGRDDPGRDGSDRDDPARGVHANQATHPLPAVGRRVPDPRTSTGGAHRRPEPLDR